MATELISIGIIFVFAVIGGIIAARLKQPAVFGLIIIGALIGPNALNLVRDVKAIGIMADIGAVLIAFAIGLEFSVSKLAKSGVRTILLAMLKFGIVLFLSYKLTLFLGISPGTSLFLGMIISFSSTMIVVKILEQKSMLSRKEVPLLIGILIIENVVAILLLTIFTGIHGSSDSMFIVLRKLLIAMSILSLSYLILLKSSKYIINVGNMLKVDDSVFVFVSLSIIALFSYFAYYLGLPASFGAFLAGSLIASMPNAKDFGKVTGPYAMVFTSMFFISIGMMVNFTAIEENIFLIMGLVIAVFLSRFIAIGFMTYFLANFRNESPFFASLAMLPIGEFSLIIAKQAGYFGVNGIDMVTMTASLIVITALAMSLTINHSERMYSISRKLMPSKFMASLESVADYLRRFFDHLDLETTFTKQLRKEAKMAILYILLAVVGFFVLVGMTPLINPGGKLWISIVLYLMGFLAMAAVSMPIYLHLKGVQHLLAVILANVDASGNLARCYRIINTMLLAFMLFFTGLLFPFVIFAFGLGKWANLIPFAVGFTAFVYFERLVKLICGSSVYTQTRKIMVGQPGSFSKKIDF